MYLELFRYFSLRLFLICRGSALWTRQLLWVSELLGLSAACCPLWAAGESLKTHLEPHHLNAFREQHENCFQQHKLGLWREPHLPYVLQTGNDRNFTQGKKSVFLTLMEFLPSVPIFQKNQMLASLLLCFSGCKTLWKSLNISPRIVICIPSPVPWVSSVLC